MSNSYPRSFKQIGIVANYECLLQWDNYGTLFQNYALQKILRSMNYDPFWIKTCSRRDMVATPQKILNKTLQLLLDPINSKTLLREFLQQRVSSSSLIDEVDRYHEFNIAHPRYFNEFMDHHMQRSCQLFPVERIRDHFPLADAYIAGSDNVWGSVSDASFLNFGSKDVHRIGYSVSAPWSNLSNYWYYKAKTRIHRFNTLSFRELEGVEVGKKLGVDSPLQTLDPTLLLNQQDYLDVSTVDEKLPKDRSLVLGYFVNLSSLSQLPWLEICTLSLELDAHLNIVPLQGAELVVPAEYVYTPSPAQWLHAYSCAQCIVTNSYHGTIFAVIMQKPFIVIPQHHSPKNERIPNLLRMLGLVDRIYMREKCLSSQIMKPIDWDDVQMRLQVQREKSIKFLESSLSSI
jgi:hypothetical protein